MRNKLKTRLDQAQAVVDILLEQQEEAIFEKGRRVGRMEAYENAATIVEQFNLPDGCWHKQRKAVAVAIRDRAK